MMELALTINLILFGFLTVLLIVLSIGQAKEEKEMRKEARKAA
ncbi:MAG: hypothetical protein V2A69_00305 [Pseudomonadota bacterium]